MALPLAVRVCPYTALPGWRDDDHWLALLAFRASCGARTTRPANRQHRHVDRALAALAGPLARLMRAGAGDRRRARRFFERHFRPIAVGPPGAPGGLLTGYFEPELDGALAASADCRFPIYARPPELVDTVDPVYRASETGNAHPAAYFTRREIDQGAIAGRGLELAYVKDEVALYFMHVQGSGRIRLADGRVLRVGFDGKNGRAYTSIAKRLVERGELSRDDVTLPVLDAWLRADPVRARKLLQENESFIFFRLNDQLAATAGPLGAMNVALTAGRSLAVDAALYPLGLPIYVSAPTLDLHGQSSFNRLMIAQDVGSAIRGEQRGDIYWGSGSDAGRLAGTTKHRGSFSVLLPRLDRAGRRGERKR